MKPRPPHLLPGQSSARHAQLLHETPLEAWSEGFARGGLFSAEKLASLAVVLMIFFSQLGLGTIASVAQETPTRTEVPVAAEKLDLPMTFERNQGQAEAEVDFMARGRGYRVFLTGGDAVVALGSGQSGFAMRMDMVGGAENPALVPLGEQPGRVNYFIGDDPAGWQTKVKSFDAVEYRDVYPGIDLRYYGNDRQLEYDFIVQPGADPSVIGLRFEGAAGLVVNEAGDLEIALNPGRNVTFSAPHTYQDTPAGRVVVDSAYRLADGTVTFTYGAYDPTLPLIIDPTLQYGSYLGGTGTDSGEAITLDGSGNMVIAGYSASTDFPVTVGAYDETANGSNDVTVTKLSADGSTLLWATYLGGSGLDNGKGIAIDDTGAVYVGVYTASSDFPTTAGAYDTGLSGSYDGAVAKLSADGATLVYSTYLGGSANNDYLRAIAVDASGQAIVAGATDSSDFPTVGGSYDTSFGGSFDAFVTKVNTTGTGLVWSTFIGGTGSDGAEDVLLDGSGTVYVTGQAASGFPTTPGAYDSIVGGTFDGHATKLSSDGSSLLYATVFGGSSSEKGTAIAAVDANTLYVGGDTPSSDFPTTPGAYDTVKSSGDDMFLLSLDLTQTDTAQLAYSTFIGGAGIDRVGDIAVDASSRAHVFGYTGSAGLATAGAYDTTLGGSSDTVLGILSADGSTMEELTYVGGDGGESVGGLYLTANSIYLTGYTTSATGLPISGAYDSSLSGTSDGFVVRFAALDAPPDPSVVTVNSTADLSDNSPGDDICDTSGTVGADPECTLRAAIQEANASATVDTIHFDIPTGDSGYTASPVAFTIEPASTLPAITTSMTIDGSTQPEYATSGRPVVEVSGSSAGSNADGFSLTGGTSTIRGLVVNNWDDEGVALTSGGNSVFGNYIGTDVTGSAAAPNKIGVILRGAGNTIGGPGADGNLISGNTNKGIMVTIGGTSTEIVGNLVGTEASGSGPLPNGGGIDLNSADDSFVGGTDPSFANTIAYNTSYGVVVTGSSDGNSILGNAIHSNGGLGIDHNNDGVTGNDVGDGDTGQNDFMNFPVVTSAVESSGNVTVTFDLDVPAGTYRVEFFDNTAADGSGYGEGEAFLGSVDVSTGTGLNHVVSGASGDIITATATESLGGGNYGSTSEFSAAVTATSDPLAPDIWLSTAADVGSPSGVSAVDSWSAGALLGFGDPSLALGPGTTGGTLTLVEDFDTQGDGNVVLVGLHQVQSTITVGTSPSVTLQPGDLLFSVANNETFDNSDLSTTDIADKDVGLFRPDAPGDYSSGSFSVVLDQPLGSNSAVTLVETETVLPDITLTAGTFVLTDSKDIYQLVPTGTGDGISPGTPSVLLLGPDAGLDKNLTAIDLVEQWTVVGDAVVPAGTLLISMDGEDPVGSNNLSTTRQDVFALTLTATTAGSATGAATASAFFVGGDVGMDTNNEAVSGFAIVGGTPATAPVAYDDAVGATQDWPAIARVLDNDVDPNGDPISLDSFTQGSNGTVTDNGDDTVTYNPDPGWTGIDTFTYVVTDGSESDSATVTVTVTPHSDPMAVWRRNGQSTPFYSTWNGSGFDPEQASAAIGEYRTMEGAESPTRDEAIVIGVTDSSQVVAEIWDGSTWTAHPSNPLSTVTDSFWWGFDVAYESVSSDAVIVYNNGTTGTAGLSYQVWNGSTWSGPSSITTPLAGEPKAMKLASHPYTDEMVLVVSNATSQDYALVWDGSNWGNAQVLASSGTGNDRTDVFVAYEQQSGDALVVFSEGADTDVHYRVWTGSVWSNEFTQTTPVGAVGYPRWITLASDPNSDRIAMGVLANGADVWLATWTGSAFADARVATTATTGTNHPSVAVAFEATSGEALATYGEGVNTPRYRTWTSGSGWSGEFSAPDVGGSSNSMTLYAEPGADGVMFAVQDDSNDLNYLYWNGSSWGSPTQLDSNTAEVKNQPFLFLWNAPETPAPPPMFTVSGTVFEDVVGDVLNDGSVGDAANPGAAGVDVYLYEDDGDGNLDSGDTLVGGVAVQTDGNGAYSFADLLDGDYFVVVDSKTVGSYQDPTAAQGDIWAEQTYGPAGGYCDTGVSFAVRGTAGPCYGGITSSVSDDFSQWDDREHRALVALSGADVANVDFGFSFNVVTTTNGGDTRDDDTGANRTVQGSLRQFIQNANAISGANVMRFVPADPAGLTDGGGNYWWRIPVTELLPTIVDDDTTIDGRAFDFTDGSTVLDTNTAQIGVGVAVGTEGTYTTPTLDPELEIWNNRGTAVVATGLVFEATDSVLRHVSIWGFGDSASTLDVNVKFGTNYSVDPDFTGSLAEFNVIGTGPASFTDPGVGNRSGQKNLTIRENDNAIVRDNLIGYAGGVGVDFNSGAEAGTVLRNEVRGNGILNPSGNPVGVWISGNVTGNLITDNASGVFSGPTLWITYEDNTISANGWGGTRPHGIEVSGSPTTIRRNVIADNAGSGVTVGATDSNILITQNSIYGNGTALSSIGIDLLASGDDDLATPFVTLNDDGDVDTGANGLLNYPVLETAHIEGGVITLTGWSPPATSIEFYVADADPAGFGEGKTWLITKTEGSVDDTDATTSTYGPGAINAISQGTDTTNRFEFSIPLASLATAISEPDQLTALAISGTNTSEFGGLVSVTANHSPVFDQDLLDRTNPEADYIALSAVATDPDAGDTLTYAATGLPLGLSIDSGTGIISGVVNHAAAASSPYSVEVSVTDGINPAVTDTFIWTISNVAANDPYLVAGTGGSGGGDDLLTTVDEANFVPATNEVDIGTGTGTSGIEAAAIEPATGTLFAVDGGQLGTLDVDTGSFSPVGTGIGTGDGEFGSITFDNITGMTFHPLTGEIWAVHQRFGLTDVMIRIDPATGAFIPSLFTGNQDYLKLRTLGAATSFTALTIDPTDWQLYGHITDGAVTSHIVEIHRRNGNVKDVGTTPLEMTDLSFDATGQLWAIDAGTLYAVDKSSAALDAGRTIDNGSAYGALAFQVPPADPPAFEGTVFQDIAGDGLAGTQFINDAANPGAEGVTVHLYLDDGAVPGEPDATDTLFDTKITGRTGKYFFEGLPVSGYYVVVDSTSVDPEAGGSGWAEQTYGAAGSATYSGAYSYSASAGPLYGGMQPTVADNAAALTSSEHVIWLDLVGGDYVEQVDFGFSFNVVTNLEGADATSPQGSLRQFLANANGVTGPNTMRFVPAVPTNATDGVNNWWSLGVSSALPAITDAATTLDGTAYDAADGSTTLDPNGLGPELEIAGLGAAPAMDGVTMTSAGNTITGLVIGGFADVFSAGVLISGAGATGNTVTGNYLGTDAAGAVANGNGDGVRIAGGATGNTIGGSTAADRNLISGNADDGVQIDGVGTDGNIVEGNYIGTDVSGAAAVPNVEHGVVINSNASNVVTENLVSGNGQKGVYIGSAADTVVTGNLIGVDASGSNPLGNGEEGVYIWNGAATNRIGGILAADANVIANNGLDGVWIDPSAGADNAVLSNSIYGNAALGIDLGGDGVTVNDVGDADSGPNDLLNFLVISSAIESGGLVTVNGTFDVPAGDYRIEYFANPAGADPSGNGEGQTFVASAVITHTGSGDELFGTVFPGSAGDVITATVTEDLGGTYGSTSEFSAAYTVGVPDITPPVISLLGANPLTVEVGSAYVEFGATATDDTDGDLTGSIVIDSSAVNISVLGSYLVTYNVSDSAGNPATEVTRTVNVVDTTTPVITLLGSNPQVIEVGTAYTELGATASDNYDGDISGSIVIDASAVDTNTVGSYSVTYDVTDANGNAATTVTRTVDVVDTTVPVITLLGSNPQVIEVGTAYTELGATASDNYDGDISGSIVIDASAVDTNTVGSYSVTYDVTDANGNAATTVTRTVDVVDTTVPVITLLGSNPQVIEVGSPYVELGATALDDFDGDISGSIVIDSSTVDTSVLGSYVVTYNVSDSAGNPATEVTRIVDVVDTTAPVLTLVGANPQTIEVGDAYAELGATAVDSFDGVLTGSIVIDASAVNTAAVGVYVVTYDVVDGSGNPANGFRTVNVVDTTVPVITLVGANPQILEAGSAYVELGATASDSFYGDISGSIVVDASAVDTNAVGSYVVTYNVDDVNGNPAVQVTRTVDVVDTGVPVITLSGADPQVIEVGDAYVELGVTAFDAGDGDLTGAVVIDATAVDTAVVGSYTVTYNVTDSQSNPAVEVTRTVDVVDTTVPVITLLGADPQVIEVGDVYVELGATASDGFYGDITGSIVVDVSGVDTSVVGSYVVTYDVDDVNGNPALQMTRTVDVVDTTVPAITLVGADPQTIEVGDAYVELGATASDSFYGDITGSIAIDASGVDTGVVGSYVVTYDVDDVNGNPALQVTRTVNVVDTTAPVITLVGADPQAVEAGSPYGELGATAFDVGDGDLTGLIVIDATAVDTNTVGSYTVTYDVTDSQGNPATQVTRTVDVVDTTAPVITLNGADPQTIEAGSPYSESGATATDNYDGNISPSIVINATAVNTGVVGSYTVTYDVADAAGNPAVQVTRAVDVVDTTVPTITLIGANPQTIEVGTPHSELGATADDGFFGDITPAIVVDASGVDTNTVGSYVVTYDVDDAAGNPAVQVTRTVNVVDTTNPVITLNGADPQIIEVGSSYTELDATATDNYDGDLTASIVIDATAVDTAVVASYLVTYSVTDSSGNPVIATRTVNVIDTTAPVITLNGANPQVIEVGSPHVEAGATASDNYDGDISGLIVTDSSAVDTSTIGSYAVTYNVTDASGNAATQVTRTVNVVDTTAPVITLLGADPQVIEAGTPYTELGATAADNYDDDISISIVVNATAVDTNVVGSYSVTYDVDDAAGNPAVQVTRTVNVVDTTPPAVTLLGVDPQTVEVGSPYVESGATALDNYDGDISGSIVINDAAVVTAVIGSYSVTYDVADAAGNPAAQVTRTVNVVDTTAPVITLVGANPQTIEAGSTYTELGATAVDIGDGDVTGWIVTDSSAVNTAAVGSYVVTYDVTDSQGNVATQLTRTVDVVDTTIPVITRNGANPQIIEAGSAYVELGASAFDIGDGDLTGSLVIDTSGVAIATVGSYVVTYDVTDSLGNNAAQVTRTVDVVDTTAPVIALNGADPQTVEAGSPYVESGATATDSYDGDITGLIVIDAAAINTTAVGSYSVTYDVTDANGNAASQVTRTVDVVDTTAPVITLNGADPQVIEVGSPYVEFGATASDFGDGDLTGSIVINPAGVDTSTVGSYGVTYDVTDSQGNAATRVVRIIDVVDTTLPVITLTGVNPQAIEAGSLYVELGATASDNYDGDVTGLIVTDATAVDTATVGSYPVTYNVTDANGNVAVQVTRTVNVTDTAAPVITLIGANPQVVEVGSPYSELGATASDVGDGDLSGSIVIDPSAVDTSVVGSYGVTYDVTDSQDNPAIQVTRTVQVVDTTLPVIALAGVNPQIVEVGSPYVELGATASDNYDGNITGLIVINAAAVDTATAGTYSVTYDVTDANGNAAVQVSRTVNVTDTTAPVVSLLGADPLILEVGSPYVEAGATAFDVGDGDLTGSIVVDSSAVDTGVVGSYLVTYDVSDSQGNAAVQVTRFVGVVDTADPVIALVGSNPQTIEVGSPYVELGATALDNYDGDISGLVVIDATGVDTALVGSYVVTYDVVDANGNAAVQVTRTVNVVDTTLPVITVVGSDPQVIEVGSIYSELGATATDNYDGDLTGLIVIDTAAVDTAVVGSYVVTYDVTDAAGNPAVQQTRTISVVDTTVPTLSLVGANPQTIEVGSPYVELGATAWDNYDGDISGLIVIDVTAVDTSVVGTYVVSYDVVDSSGNAAFGFRTVNLVDTTAPVITLVGPDPQVIEVGSAYAELGATAWDNYDGGISGSIVIDATGVDTSVLGSYVVTYDVTDAAGNPAVQVTRTVNVVDTTLPVITLVGANPQTVDVGSAYVELGATASDNYDGDISGLLVIDATGVNTAVVGSYTVFYDVTDSNGNPAVQVTRVVNVVNVAPTLAPIADQAGPEQTTITFTAIGSDPDPTDTLSYSLSGAPAGAAIDAATGIFTWTPSEAQGPGTYTFDVIATDAPGLSDQQSLTVTVVEVNTAPVLAPITPLSVDELDGLTFTAGVTDTDLPANSLAFSLAGAPSGATINTTTGVVSWTPTETQGPATYNLDIIVDDAGSPNMTDTQTITVTVAEVNTAPVVSYPGAQSSAEADRISLAISATDADIPVNALTYSAIGLPDGLTIDSGSGEIAGTITYDASPGSPFSVTVTATDDGAPARSHQTTFDWFVADSNRDPVPADDNVSASEDSARVFAVLSNDSDPDFDALSISAVASPSHGSATVSGAGVLYTPAADYFGADSFDYTVSDGLGGVASATVSVSVVPVNDAPMLTTPVSLTGNEGSPISFTASATDIERDVVRFSLAGAPTGASIDPVTGFFSWVPSEVQGPGTHGFDVVAVDDGSPALSTRSRVQITVAETNAAPVITNPGSQVSGEDRAVSLQIVASDSDVPAGLLRFSAVGLPPGLSIDPTDGEISGRAPFDAVNGSPYSVTVTVTDDGVPQRSSHTSFTWTIVNTNRVPSAVDLTVFAEAGVPASLILGGSDPDGDVLLFDIAAGPSQGVLTGGPRLFDYIADVDADGTDVFTFTVSDGDLSAVGTVSVVVTPNRVPTGGTDEFQVRRGGVLVVDAPGVLGNDRDPEGRSLSVVVDSLPVHGSVVLRRDGSFDYYHRGGDVDVDSFTYRVDDGMRLSEPVTVRIVVVVNVAPVVVDDSVVVDEDQSVVFHPLGNDSDANGEALVVTSVSEPGNGSVEWSLDGAFIYTPEPDWFGTDTLLYTVSDGDLSGSGRVEIVVRPVNDAPVAAPVEVTGHSGEPLIVDLRPFVSDVDGDVLDFILETPVTAKVTQTQPGVFEIGLDGVIHDMEPLTFVVSDPTGERASSLLTVIIRIPASLVGVPSLVSGNFGNGDGSGGDGGDPASAGQPAGGVPLLTGLRLMVGSVFDTFRALRVPLFVVLLLGLGSLWLGLSNKFAFVSTPTVLPLSGRRKVDVVMALSGAGVPARVEPGSHQGVKFRFAATERGIVTTGARMMVRSEVWVEVETPEGDGWINAEFLTEQVADSVFEGDERPAGLVAGLVERIYGTDDLLEVTAGHDLHVGYFGPPIRFAASSLPRLLRGASVYWWWQPHGDAPSRQGTFEETVGESITAAYRNQGTHQTESVFPVALEFVNMHSLVIGNDEHGEGWRIYFRYENDEPSIAGLTREAQPNPAAMHGQHTQKTA